MTSAPTSLGLHHVTALASDPQTNLDFYAGLLGLRLVKKTVNFDDPGTYHLYYGDEAGSPGSILTFFPWPGARRGSRGVGQATRIRFGVPSGSLPFWEERLARHGVTLESRFESSGPPSLGFLDPDGLALELVEKASVPSLAWLAPGIAIGQALRGFHSVELLVESAEPTASVLARLGYGEVDSPSRARRFGLAGGGGFVDLVEQPSGVRGRIAAGSVHHIAFRAADQATQLGLADALRQAGLQVTPVLDRNYFLSVYSREPGGVLFEIATDPPGFAVDEPLASLGGVLRLPKWLEPHREEIAAHLPRLESPDAARLLPSKEANHG